MPFTKRIGQVFFIGLLIFIHGIINCAVYLLMVLGVAAYFYRGIRLR